MSFSKYHSIIQRSVNVRYQRCIELGSNSVRRQFAYMRVRNLKLFSHFVFLSALVCDKIFIKTDSTESGCVIGPENILFTGDSVRLSAHRSYRLGQ